MLCPFVISIFSFNRDRRTGIGACATAVVTMRWILPQKYTAIHMTLVLRLLPVAVQNLLKALINSGHFSDDVDRTQDELIQMPVPHEISLADNRMLEAGPDFELDILLCNSKSCTDVLKTHSRQVVYLSEEKCK